MGDMNDYYMGLALDNGEWFPTGGARRALMTGERYHNPNYKTCNRCGEGGLRWRETPTGWRLFGEALHVCGPDPSKDFD